MWKGTESMFEFNRQSRNFQHSRLLVFILGELSPAKTFEFKPGWHQVNLHRAPTGLLDGFDIPNTVDRLKLTAFASPSERSLSCQSLLIGDLLSPSEDRVADVNPGDFRGDDVLEVSGSNPHLSESVGCEWLLKLHASGIQGLALHAAEGCKQSQTLGRSGRRFLHCSLVLSVTQ